MMLEELLSNQCAMVTFALIGGLVSNRRPSYRKITKSTLVLVLTLLSSKQVMGSLLDDTIRKWSDYKLNCTKTLTSKNVNRSAVYCRASFDKFACWPESPPGNVSVPCPHYLPWIKEGGASYLYRICTDNGTWLTVENSTDIWRDHSECSELNRHFKQQEDKHALLSVLQFIYTIGYSLSLFSLLLAVLILLLLRKLHCTRNYIHINLFASFMFRAVSVLVKDIILHITYAKRPTDETGWIYYFNSEISAACIVTQVSMHYFAGANVFWLLVEGIYLHSLLFTAVLSEKRLLKKYMFIGWGTPVLYVVPWAVTKAIYENKGCWSENINMGYWWIIRAPMAFSFTANFYIFVKILKLLFSKLKAEQIEYNDYKYRLARATLILIPLLGINGFVFAFIVDEQVEGQSRDIRLFSELTINSFQGFLVALLYCFSNAEVQVELKKRWRFLFTNHFEHAADCILGKHFKYLGKYSKRRPNRYFHQSEFYIDGRRPSSMQFLQVPLRRNTVEYFTRGSVSSSEGEGTLGETLEEILEESEI
ncbi:glucagon-like peptide 2 receptor isoform X1 [Acipenser ruthenus]|uniref:glucagon-like peptide 2 receptor isoform X1 n=2 Tax=Acipenser ruthenus TaxID=7906 RepID=UPI0027410D50|nr:glucagon-like peptide 2 receptor isoform X1 [Acipenser ruthenus]